MLLETEVTEYIEGHRYVSSLDDEEQIKLEMLADFINKAIEAYYDAPIVYFD